MARESYVINDEPPRFLMPVERFIEKVAARFGISEEEAARNLLNEEEFERWLADRARA